MNKEYFFINFFRALAAFWVILAHSMIWGGWYGLPVPNAKIAVDLFMMISGYLMMSKAFSRIKLESLCIPHNWLHFWIRRFFRIAPAYYVSLFVAIATSNWFLSGYQALQNMNTVLWEKLPNYNPANIEYTIENILLHITFLFGLYPTYSFSTFLPDWSLSLEMQFYFIFPVLFLLMQKYGKIKMILSISLLSFSVGIGIASHVSYYEPSLLFFKLQYFFAGILIYYILNNKHTFIKNLVLILIGLFIVSLEIKYGKQLIVLPFLLLSMLSLGWLEQNNKLPTLFFKLLHSKVIEFMSETAYGIYLFHGFFISAAGLIILNSPYLLSLSLFSHTLFIFLFIIFFAYPLAYVILLYIEKPGISLGKLIINYRKPK
ncbi:acyltransferase [bacterium]|nr:acyltransferase [bacterium]MBU1433418.1 acyltransferase [bacterium]